jgi:hypothetical protein
MKINDILYDILLEEFENKKILRTCMLNWYGENPTNEQLFEADNLLTKFYELKTGNKLKTTDAEVITFLNNFPDFNDSNIPNATSYSLQQMKLLIGEFYELKPQALDKLKSGRYLYLVGKESFIPHEKGANKKFFSQNPVTVLQKEKISNVYEYLIENKDIKEKDT